MALALSLATLETSGLIHPALLEPEMEYLFRHALIQDAAYGSLLKTDRKILHRTVGETLEQLYPDRQAELAPRLGEHFAEAGDSQRAVRYFTLAGDEAAHVYANAEAIGHYRRALELARQMPARMTEPLTNEPLTTERWVHLYTSLGRALELNARYDEEYDLYRAMEQHAHQLGDQTLELAALIARATLRVTPTPKYDFARGEALSHQALTLAQTLGDPRAEAKIHWNLMLLYRTAHRAADAIWQGERSLALAREHNLREQLAFALHDLTLAYTSGGQRARALAHQQEAIPLWRELGNRPMLADGLGNLAIIHFFSGQFAQSEATAEEGYDVSRTIGNFWGQAYTRGTLGYIYLEWGDVDRALSIMNSVLQVAAQAGLAMALAGVGADQAWAYCAMGALEQGRALAKIARAYTQLPQPPFLRAWAFTSLARAHILLGDLAQAEADVTEAAQGLNLNELTWVSPIFMALAQGELALARHDEARVLAVMDELLAHLRPAGVRVYIPDALYLQSRVWLVQGETERAYALLQQARVEAEAIGSRRSLWPILAALSQLEAQRGQTAEAEALYTQARALLAYIADHCPPDLRESFLNLPDVRRVMVAAP